MKASFSIDTSGHVTLAYDDQDGDRVTREFTAPVGRGYVREWCNGEWKQVCDRLSSMGSTLMGERATLINTIRREYSAMRSAERREASRDVY